jgi:hypothetical protein
MLARAPGLKRLPLLKWLSVAEIARLAHEHAKKLDKADQRRVVELLRKGTTMSSRERDELGRLLNKAEPRLFAGLAADKLSPVPLPRRVVRGPKPKRAG